MSITPSATGLQLARQLLARETVETYEPAAASAAIHRALTRVSENLRRSVGDDGYSALLSRAIARTQSEHPALVDIRRDDNAGFSVDGVAAGVDTHGVAVVSLALESLLASVVDVLSGLIGADMVLNLLDPDGQLAEPRERRSSQ